ncbi:MAG: 16S rRNA (cytosine(967)-C(5))-methyltransferase RsmB [Lachnospiraceae bacterium]|nr:16S rRNA (cytosine(967)-C(5))-methyltransferase RsmB [Lachnospiraceae bacterium]
MTDVRMVALDILLEYSGSKAFLSEVTKAALAKYAYLEERDRAFIKNLVTGCVEKQIALDFVIGQVSSVKPAKMKKIIKLIIRMAVYEILYLDHIPVRASVNEAVRLAKKKHIAGLSGFVNAVTRKAAALYEEGGIVYPDDRIRYSCPQVIYDILSETYGPEKTSRIIKASDGLSPQYIRVNVSKTDPDTLIETLNAEGIKACKTPVSKNALKTAPFNPAASPAFMEGLFSMQDASGIAALDAAGIRENERIIDLCASPGGKACLAAEYMRGTGKVLAFDISEEKKKRIDENIERLKLSNIESGVKDALIFDETLENSADLVIADLPCSGLGVMGRKVDIKYRIQRDDILQLQELQRRMLDNAVRYVNRGGKLLFSTCTITGEESVLQREYIESISGLTLLEERQFLQGVDECDGFYYAVFQR